ncbi:MAG: phosphatidate cytidylyltransferase [Bacteroidota bacterium]
MSNFWQRTITGVVFVIVVIGSLLADYLIFAGVIAVFTVVGLWEFYLLAEKKNIFPLKYAGITAGGFIFIITVFSNSHFIDAHQAEKYFVLVFLYIILFFIAELYRKSDNALQNISMCLAGLIYVAIPFSILISLPVVVEQNISFGKVILISFFLLMWIYDIFAYLTGMWMGRHKLFERISPKKSWEGFIGGAVFCIALSVVMSFYYTGLTIMQWIMMAILIIVFGTFGDLVESMFKRSVNCKDSGKFFPGHGGVLDRFDAVLLAAPFVYFYLRFFI